MSQIFYAISIYSNNHWTLNSEVLLSVIIQTSHDEFPHIQRSLVFYSIDVCQKSFIFIVSFQYIFSLVHGQNELHKL